MERAATPQAAFGFGRQRKDLDWDYVGGGGGGGDGGARTSWRRRRPGEDSASGRLAELKQTGAAQSVWVSEPDCLVDKLIGRLQWWPPGGTSQTAEANNNWRESSSGLFLSGRLYFVSRWSQAKIMKRQNKFTNPIKLCQQLQVFYKPTRLTMLNLISFSCSRATFALCCQIVFGRSQQRPPARQNGRAKECK